MNMSNIPTILVIFGATGDLMRKKLAPALFHLQQKGKLPEHFKIVAFSRRDFDDHVYREYLAEILQKHHNIKPENFSSHLGLYTYVKGDFTERGSYQGLAGKLKGIDAGWGLCSNKLFYLAVAPEMYRTIFNELASSGLTEPCSPEEGWSRIIVEKPFGKDFTTAQKLDELLGKLFREVQIYRIDHYLAKEMLQNILAFRFSNNLFEKNWSNEAIERIDIKLWEKLGVEERGVFYDSIGALRDVGQNHLLQMLALVTMELPPGVSAPAVREKRAQILARMRSPSLSAIKESSVRAQYIGYRSIKGVNPDSATETYFRVVANLETARWRGVPIVIESGKRLGKAKKEIVVTFKHPTPCLCLGEHHQNKVVFALEPEEKISIHFWSKKPGLETTFEGRTFDFLLRGSGQRVQYVEEYEKLLLDCIAGDQTLFISTEEVRAMWKFIDPIIRAWKRGVIPLKEYQPDTDIITEEASRAVTFAPKPSGKKEMGLVGLGKMGMNIALRLADFGWRIVAFDSDSEKQKAAKEQGITLAENLRELVSSTASPRLIWLMIPAGSPVDKILFGEYGLAGILAAGDVIIDGGNSFYEDSIRRGRKLGKNGIYFLDAGVSGGPEGARTGLAIMVGGEKKPYDAAEHLFRDLAVSNGFLHAGKSGAGHFAKMVHNGIEYGMMQAVAEGFSVMKKSTFRLNLEKVAEIFNRGSVIESRLVGWLAKAFNEYGTGLKDVTGKVGHTGEGEWMIKTAKKLKVPTPVIEEAFQFRVKSKKKPSFTGKILSALRNQFGGHSISPSQKGKEI